MNTLIVVIASVYLAFSVACVVCAVVCAVVCSFDGSGRRRRSK